MFTELAGDFVADIPRLTKKMVRSLEADDLDALRDVAHELKGVAVLFGASDLAAACTKIMALKTLDGVRTTIDETLALCDEATRVVRAAKLQRASP